MAQVMTINEKQPLPVSEQASDLEITPAMLEAGVDAMYDTDLEDVGGRELVRIIYCAMIAAARKT